MANQWMCGPAVRQSQEYLIMANKGIYFPLHNIFNPFLHNVEKGKERNVFEVC